MSPSYEGGMRLPTDDRRSPVADRPPMNNPDRNQPGHDPGWPTERRYPACTEVDEAFDVMVRSLRRFQEALATSRPSVELATEVARHLHRDAAALEAFGAAEHERPFGNLWDRPGRAQAMAPPFTCETMSAEKVSGTAYFSDFYLGVNGAVHGGAVPLIFDEVLGRLANVGRPRTRTAYLHVDYRRVTPIHKTLRLDAWMDRIDGRKLYLNGLLRDGVTVLAEASGLFVILRPGQP